MRSLQPHAILFGRAGTRLRFTASAILATFLALHGITAHSQASDVESDGGTAVTGRVTDVDGNAIAGARLLIKKWQSGPHHASETESGADGRFLLPALPSNSRLFVFADGYASMFRTHDVSKGINRGWDFVLPRSAHVSGTVLDTNGNPAAGRVFELWPVNSGPPPAPGVNFYPSGGEGRNMTNASGEFDMPNVAPGKYRIILYRPMPSADRSMQQIPVNKRFLEVESGDRIEGLEIVMNPPEEFAIAGTVRDTAGNPMPGISVDSFIPHGRHWWTKTDEDGSFMIDGLDGIGQSSVLVHFNGVSGADDFRLGIPDIPLNTRDLELVVPGVGTIEGAVRNAETGEAVSTYDVSVPVIHLPDSGAVWEKPRVNTVRKRDGGFMISQVPAGRATVEVHAHGLGAQRFVIDVAAGETTPLDCAMLGPAVFEGRTIMDGEPRQTTIVINGEWLSSDDDGQFRFDDYPNGELLAWFFVYDGWHRTVKVDLRSGETTRRDVELGGSCEVYGTVTFSDDEEDFCTIRLASKEAPDGWYETGRPRVDEYVLAYSHVRESGGEYRLPGIPPGRWYLMAGAYRPSMHRSLLAESHEINLQDGQTLNIDFDLTRPGE